METIKRTFKQLVSLKKLILIILPALIIISCSPEDNGSTADQSSQTLLPIESFYTQTSLIAEGSLYGIVQEAIQQQNIRITDENTWIRLLHQLDAVNSVSESFTETDIDFNEFEVIAVFDEVQDSGDHSVELEFELSDDFILVKINKKQPEAHFSTVKSQPYNIVKIPSTGLPIVFRNVGIVND